jgi:beta-glucosidase
MDLSGSPVGAFVSPTLDSGHVLPAGAFSARWTGTLTPSTTGTYRFALEPAGIARLFIDGQLVASADTEGLDSSALGFPGAPVYAAQGVAALSAGTAVPITVEYSFGSSISGSVLHLGWQPPDSTLVAAAASAASTADVAIVFVNDVTSEGMDRTSLALPGDQDALISAVAAANPRTIVVLHTAGPVLMPWLPEVAAVIEAWYPGEETGNAIAAVLFGDVDPSGRLAMTFPAAPDQGPGPQPAEYPGVGNVVTYDEGIFVGYRYYDAFGQQPLFPFGYGLSYTSFSLDRLHVRRRASRRYDVSVRVKNTGTRKGAAVVELYVGFPASTEEPPNQLKGFRKILVAPNRAKHVRMTLDPSSFASWSTTANAWTVVPGAYTVRLGTSSRDLPLETGVTVD